MFMPVSLWSDAAAPGPVGGTYSRPLKLPRAIRVPLRARALPAQLVSRGGFEREADPPLRVLGRGIEPVEVLAHHAVRGEALDAHGDGRAHHSGPAGRIGPGREHLALERVVERVQVPRVLTRPFPRVANGPARDTVLAALRPPAVEDGEVESAVHGRLHARGSARLHGPAGSVQPHVTAAREQAPQSHAVVLEVDDGLRPLANRLDEERDDGLTLLVGGMRLAGEDELEAAVLEQGSEPGGGAEQESGA